MFKLMDKLSARWIKKDQENPRYKYFFPIKCFLFCVLLFGLCCLVSHFLVQTLCLSFCSMFDMAVWIYIGLYAITMFTILAYVFRRKL